MTPVTKPCSPNCAYPSEFARSSRIYHWETKLQGVGASISVRRWCINPDRDEPGIFAGLLANPL